MKEFGLVESGVGEEVKGGCRGVCGVVNGVKVIVRKYGEGKVEEMEGMKNGEDLRGGRDRIELRGELWMEGDDLMEDGGKKYLGMSGGEEVGVKKG